MLPRTTCHRIHFPAAVLGLAVLVSFTCAHAAEEDWTTVDAERQEVDMYVPGMSTWRPGYGKRIYDRSGSAGVLYYTKWGGLLSDRPNAYLTHQQMRKRFRYISLTELIRFFMDTSYTTKAKVLSLKTDTSEHGGFKYINFDIQTPSKIRSWFGFMRLSTGNKKFTYGHYCLPDEGEITFKTISQIIDSVTIHGTASEPEGGIETAQKTKDTPRQIDSGSQPLRRPIAVQWDGVDGPIAGYVQITGDGKFEKIKLTLPGSLGECTGKAEYKKRNSGLWFIKCGNGKSASGAFLAHGSGKGSSGDGYDNNGRKVKFTISGE